MYSGLQAASKLLDEISHDVKVCSKIANLITSEKTHVSDEDLIKVIKTIILEKTNRTIDNFLEEKNQLENKGKILLKPASLISAEEILSEINRLMDENKSQVLDLLYDKKSPSIDLPHGSCKELPNFPKFTQEKTERTRRLREEVEMMVAEFKVIDDSVGDENEEKNRLLKKYGIRKWLGKSKDKEISKAELIDELRSYGDPIKFIRIWYGRWIDAGVIFKNEIRIIDKKLVTDIRNKVSRSTAKDPMLDRTECTEFLANGVFGQEEAQAIARANINARAPQRELQRKRNKTVNFRR